MERRRDGLRKPVKANLEQSQEDLSPEIATHSTRWTCTVGSGYRLTRSITPEAIEHLGRILRDVRDRDATG